MNLGPISPVRKMKTINPPWWEQCTCRFIFFDKSSVRISLRNLTLFFSSIVGCTVSLHALLWIAWYQKNHHFTRDLPSAIRVNCYCFWGGNKFMFVSSETLFKNLLDSLRWGFLLFEEVAKFVGCFRIIAKRYLGLYALRGS